MRNPVRTVLITQGICIFVTIVVMIIGLAIYFAPDSEFPVIWFDTVTIEAWDPGYTAFVHSGFEDDQGWQTLRANFDPNN